MRLYSIYVQAVAHSSLEWGSPGDTSSAVPGEAITILGRRCRTNGLAYVTLPDGYVLDATPILDPQYTNYTYNVEATPAELEVFSSGVNITDTTQQIQAGRRAFFSCGLYPEIATITNFVWTIGGYYLSNWVATESFADVYAVSNYTNANIDLFWWQPGTNLIVQCSVIVEGEAMSAKAFFNVTIENASITATPKNVIAVDTAYDASGLPALHFGQADNLGPPGVKFARTPNAYPGWKWVQLIGTLRRQRIASTTIWTNQSGFGLDTQYPYTGAENPLYETQDSPGMQFFTNVEQATIQDSFRMFLMHDPASGWPVSVPVPIWQVDWSWAGNALLTNGAWRLVSPTNAFSITNSVPAGGYPTWTNNFKFFPWQ